MKSCPSLHLVAPSCSHALYGCRLPYRRTSRRRLYFTFMLSPTQAPIVRRLAYPKLLLNLHTLHTSFNQCLNLICLSHTKQSRCYEPTLMLCVNAVFPQETYDGKRPYSPAGATDPTTNILSYAKTSQTMPSNVYRYTQALIPLLG